MKRNKVLLGLYVGLLTLAGGVANAQTGGSNSKFYEVGPANIGGEISSIVVDRQDTSRNTLYAGAATGGLFLQSKSMDILLNLYNNLGTDPTRAQYLSTDTIGWHHVPFYQNGREISLPISCMTQGPNGVIYIGTGSDKYAYGTTYKEMSRKGMGIYRYNPQTNTFALIPTTNPANDTNFSTINALELLYSDNTLYLYAATNSGLYRWLMVDGNDNWTATPTRVFAGRVDNIVISRRHNVAFFSCGNKLYRIGDVTAAPSALATVDISSSNSAFGGNNIGMKLAISQTDTMFLYAMVINQSGYMDALYMTMDEQHWTTLTTSTVMPLTYNSGKDCGAVTVDPGNPRRVFIAGTDIYVGRGYVDGNYYQWTTASASEHTLNYGEYMSTVYGNGSFVHSGIHQMVPVYHVNPDGTDYHTFFIATDGGVFSAKHYGDLGFGAFQSENRGLNTLQINGLAVSPDGTIIMGANKNSCPVVEAHLAHNGGEATLSWYDDGSLGNFNHDANVLWTGNGGVVAASSFQQVKPLSRRTIFTTSASGFAGRSYADYLNYNNTTTWTVDSSFTTNKIVDGPEIGQITLWETDNNTLFNDSVDMQVDTLGVIFRKNGSKWDTLWVNDTAWGENRGGKFQILRGDKAIFYSRANADYPFEYTFTSRMKAKETIRVQNPIQSRALIIGEAEPVNYTVLGTVGYPRSVWMAWYPVDFTRVWDAGTEEDALGGQTELFEKLQYWSPIYCVERKEGTSTETVYPRMATFSKDGLTVYVVNYDVVSHQSMLVRLRGFQNIDYSKSNRQLIEELSYSNAARALVVDTLRFNGSVWFPRPISNIAVDGRNGQDRLVLTFEDYSTAMANVAIVNNASSNGYSITEMPINNTDLPAYCAIVEDSTGTIFVGTADGVYTKTGAAGWQTYNKLFGVPVTSIVQQTKKMDVRRNLTHTGITANKYVFAKTKWPRAIYFGTYGRGVFMDMKYVTDTINEICDSTDYNNVGIPTVHSVSPNSVKLYPNPVYNEANLLINANTAGNAVLRVYDLNGRLVMNRNMGFIAEGEQHYTIDCTGMSKGMYLINVIIGGHTSTAKMIVK